MTGGGFVSGGSVGLETPRPVDLPDARNPTTPTMLGIIPTMPGTTRCWGAGNSPVTLGALESARPDTPPKTVSGHPQK